MTTLIRHSDGIERGIADWYDYLRRWQVQQRGVRITKMADGSGLLEIDFTDDCRVNRADRTLSVSFASFDVLVGYLSRSRMLRGENITVRAFGNIYNVAAGERLLSFVRGSRAAGDEYDCDGSDDCDCVQCERDRGDRG